MKLKGDVEDLEEQGDDMNTKVLFSSNSDMWETPQWLFDKLNSEFNFNLDVCAVPENAKCAVYYTPIKEIWFMP